MQRPCSGFLDSLLACKSQANPAVLMQADLTTDESLWVHTATSLQLQCLSQEDSSLPRGVTVFLSHLHLGLVIHYPSELSAIFQSTGCFCFWNIVKLILAVLCFLLHNVGRNTTDALSVSSV